MAQEEEKFSRLTPVSFRLTRHLFPTHLLEIKYSTDLKRKEGLEPVYGKHVRFPITFPTQIKNI